MDYNHLLSTSQRQRPPPPRLQQQPPQLYHLPQEGLASKRKPVSFNLISSTAWKPKAVYPPQQRSTPPLTNYHEPETTKPSPRPQLQPTQPAFKLPPPPPAGQQYDPENGVKREKRVVVVAKGGQLQAPKLSTPSPKQSPQLSKPSSLPQPVQPLQLPPPSLPPEQQNHHKNVTESEKKPDSSNLIAADHERKDDVHPADIVQRASQATSAPATTPGSCEGNMNPDRGGHESSREKQTIEKEKNNRSGVFNGNTNEPASTATTRNPVCQPGISSSMPPTPTAPSISPQPHVAPGPHSNAKPYGRMDETVNGLSSYQSVTLDQSAKENREQKKNNIAAGPTVPAKLPPPPPTKDPGDDGGGCPCCSIL
ncbi:hypothetical protein Ancab_000831 [Ancistrocladus abbreviatus]